MQAVSILLVNTSLVPGARALPGTEWPGAGGGDFGPLCQSKEHHSGGGGKNRCEDKAG